MLSHLYKLSASHVKYIEIGLCCSRQLQHCISGDAAAHLKVAVALTLLCCVKICSQEQYMHRSSAAQLKRGMTARAQFESLHAHEVTCAKFLHVKVCCKNG